MTWHALKISTVLRKIFVSPNVVLFKKLQVIACVNNHDLAFKTKTIFPGGTISLFLHFMKENFSEGLANPQTIDLYFTTRKCLEEI